MWHRQVEREALGRVARRAEDRERALGSGRALSGRPEPRARRRDAGDRTGLGPIRAVLFDAGATLLHPDPPVEQVYARELAADGARFTARSALRSARRTPGRSPAEARPGDRYGGVSRRAGVLAQLPRPRARRARRGTWSRGAPSAASTALSRPGLVGGLRRRRADPRAARRRPGFRWRSSRTGTRICRRCSRISASRRGSTRCSSRPSRRPASRTRRSSTGPARGLGVEPAAGAARRGLARARTTKARVGRRARRPAARPFRPARRARGSDPAA